MSRVRCYAGTRYPERPTAFEWEGRWLTVIDVLQQVRTPQGIVFDALAEDHRRYRLEWIESSDAWFVTIQP